MRKYKKDKRDEKEERDEIDKRIDEILNRELSIPKSYEEKVMRTLERLEERPLKSLEKKHKMWHNISEVIKNVRNNRWKKSRTKNKNKAKK